MAILDAKSSKVTALGNTYLFGSTIKESVAKSALATFADGGDKYPMLSLTGYINPVQSGSGDPSPSNIRPITGWTGMNVYRTGKNLIPSVTHIGSHSDVTYTVNTDGSISLSGTATATSYFEQGSLATRIPLKAGKYYISGGLSSSVRLYLGGAYADGDAIPAARDTGSGATLNLTKEANVYLQVSVASGTNTNGMVIYPMISTVQGQAYEPYAGTVYAITWSSAGTVYGGTLDVTTGLLTVNMGSVDLGTLTWQKYTNGNNWGFYADISGAKSHTTSDVVNAVCSQFKVVTPVVGASDFVAGEDNTISGNGGAAGRYIVKCTAYSDAASFKTAMSGVYFVYELATPQTYQLTPTEVLSVLGTNNVWVDTNGDVECTYIADTKLYIDSKL